MNTSISEKSLRISIVIPTYNGADIVAESLDSVANQNYPDFQTIVVNDCSTDGTREVCERFDVTLVNLESNAGPANARNIGVGRADGDIILFIDTGVVLDDPDTLDKLAKKFVENPEISGVTMIRNKSALNSGLTPTYWSMINYHEWLRAPKYHTSFATERAAIRARVLKGMNLFDEKFKGADVEDHEFGFRLFEEGHKILVARDIEVSDRFDTLRQASRKLIRRSYYWLRLFLKRKKFDTVWNTQDRAEKTLVGALCFPLIILSLITFNIFAVALCLILLLAFLIYTIKFYSWVAMTEKKPHLVLPFVLLDIYFSFIIAVGASWSLAAYFAGRIFRRGTD